MVIFNSYVKLPEGSYFLCLVSCFLLGGGWRFQHVFFASRDCARRSFLMLCSRWVETVSSANSKISIQTWGNYCSSWCAMCKRMDNMKMRDRLLPFWAPEAKGMWHLKRLPEAPWTCYQLRFLSSLPTSSAISPVSAKPKGCAQRCWKTGGILWNRTISSAVPQPQYQKWKDGNKVNIGQLWVMDANGDCIWIYGLILCHKFK